MQLSDNNLFLTFKQQLSQLARFRFGEEFAQIQSYYLYICAHFALKLGAGYKFGLH